MDLTFSRTGPQRCGGFLVGELRCACCEFVGFHAHLRSGGDAFYARVPAFEVCGRYPEQTVG